MQPNEIIVVIHAEATARQPPLWVRAQDAAKAVVLRFDSFRKTRLDSPPMPVVLWVMAATPADTAPRAVAKKPTSPPPLKPARC